MSFHLLKTVVIFAHPDDELLWTGGFLLRYKERLQIDFICLTAPFNISRIYGLINLDRYFKTGKIICLGFEDDPAVYREGADLQFDDGWIEALNFDDYGLILSHNKEGEYGHPHHAYVHQTLKNRGISFISFGHSKSCDFKINLSPEEIKRKQEVMRDLYSVEVKRRLTRHSYWDTNQEKFKFEGPREDFLVAKEFLNLST